MFDDVCALKAPGRHIAVSWRNRPLASCLPRLLLRRALSVRRCVCESHVCLDCIHHWDAVAFMDIAVSDLAVAVLGVLPSVYAGF